MAGDDEIQKEWHSDENIVQWGGEYKFRNPISLFP